MLRICWNIKLYFNRLKNNACTVYIWFFLCYWLVIFFVIYYMNLSLLNNCIAVIKFLLSDKPLWKWTMFIKIATKPAKYVIRHFPNNFASFEKIINSQNWKKSFKRKVLLFFFNDFLYYYIFYEKNQSDFIMQEK